MTDCTEGQCFCGSVTYRIRGRATSFQHCHCTQCQRIHGASFVSWLGFRTDDCRISDPGRAAKCINTGAANRHFCANCGTHFLFEYGSADGSQAADGRSYVPAATITATTLVLDDRINAPGCERFHIEKDRQPEWTRDFVDLR
jgi:hypothetical protein